MREFEDLKIAVAGTGYVGMSIATLPSQHHQVTAVDVSQALVLTHVSVRTTTIQVLDMAVIACLRIPSNS